MTDYKRPSDFADQEPGLFEQDFIKVFGSTIWDVKAILGNENAMKRVAWNAVKDRHLDESAIYDYYMGVPHGIVCMARFVQIFLSKEAGCNGWSKHGVYKYAMALPEDSKVLDYGAGPGGFSYWRLSEGNEVVMLDVPHHVFRFHQYRAKKYKFNVKFVEAKRKGLAKIGDGYNFIYASDVAEHVFEPMKLLRQLMDALNPNCILYFAPFFDDMNGHDPSHLKQNTERYHFNDMWEHHILDNGFTRLADHVYRKDK